MDYWKKRKTESVRLEKVEFKVFGLGGATWVADDAQRKAAWEMYVELVTRVAVVPLREGDGLIREALSSLHSLFAETRRILKLYGPAVARRLRLESLSFADIAIAVLNRGIRPFLTKWHPRLSRFEVASNATPREEEWPEVTQCRRELDELRAALSAYADILAEAAGVDPIQPAASHLTD